MAIQPAVPGIPDLAKRFTYHPPGPDQVPVYEAIRARGRDFAEWLDKFVPDGREKSLAITHIEQAVMWANAGVARA